MVRWQAPRLSLEWLTVSATPPKVCCLNLSSRPRPWLLFTCSCSCPSLPHVESLERSDLQAGFWRPGPRVTQIPSPRCASQAALKYTSVTLRDSPLPASCLDRVAAQDSCDTDAQTPSLKAAEASAWVKIMWWVLSHKWGRYFFWLLGWDQAKVGEVTSAALWPPFASPAGGS